MELSRTLINALFSLTLNPISGKKYNKKHNKQKSEGHSFLHTYRSHKKWNDKC